MTPRTTTKESNMGIKVTDLGLSHVKAGATRQHIHNLTDRAGHHTMEERQAFADKKGERNVTKYWDFDNVLEFCSIHRVPPVLTKTGIKHVKKSGGLEYVSIHDEAPKVEEKESKEAILGRMLRKEREELNRVLHEEKKANREVEVKGDTEAERQRKREALRQMISREIEAQRGRDDEAIKELIAGVSQAAAGAVLDTKGGELLRKIREHGDATLAEALKRIDEARPVVHVFKGKDGEEVRIDGLLHPAVDDVLTLARMRKNIAMIGPSGCGKTHLAEQIAEILGKEWGIHEDLRFGSISCTLGMSETKITGGFLPTGEAGRFEPFITDFIRIFRDGGVFLFDEWDAADDNVALQVNSALSNGYMDLMGLGRIKRHENFVCIAAMNTFGTGANRMYTSRSQLDEATLDRFRIGQIEMDYDRNLEAKLITDREWLELAWSIRDKINETGVRRNMSTRFIKDGFDMKGAGWDHDKILRIFTSGWSANEVAKVGLSHLRK